MNDADDKSLREMRVEFKHEGADQANDRSTPATAKRKMGDNPQFMRLIGSAQWLKAREKQQFRTKVFKSGNSIAVRIPAGTKLEAGMEMDLIVEDGVFLSLEPVERPKRKFNIAKVAGSATSLKLIDDDARLFEERSLDWPDRKA